MAAKRVVRPVVRSFEARFEREAAAHVRAGGHAIVWDSRGQARLIVTKPGDDPMDLGYWSALDIGRFRHRLVKEGPLEGLAAFRVPRDALGIVRRRAERDSIHPAPTRVIEFDCLACGACCRDNFVELDKDDVARFETAGRAELSKPPYTRHVDGKLALRLTRTKACCHLQHDNRCGIYALRPSACSMFPVGSESCLSAREEDLDLVDGLADSVADCPRGV